MNFINDENISKMNLIDFNDGFIIDETISLPSLVWQRACPGAAAFA